MKLARRIPILALALLASCTGISSRSTTNAPTAVDAVPSDDALRSYIGQSELVVVGEMLTDNANAGDLIVFAPPEHFPEMEAPDNPRSLSPDQVRAYYRTGSVAISPAESANAEQFKVAYTIKGEAQPTNILVADDRYWPGQNMVYPYGQIVLFLHRLQDRNSTNLEPFWRPRDATFGVMPATPALVASLKRLAATQKPDSGEEQLGALMRKFAPNCALREVKYKIGDKTYSTAVLFGGQRPMDRREMKWVAGRSRFAPTNITVVAWPMLLNSLGGGATVQTARDAEDYVKFVFGMCAGPRTLEYWKVKAEPLTDGWLVTPTYIGPPAEVRTVGPMQLFTNLAGMAIGVNEWRPNFKPGQTAGVMRPTGMNPDGLDPAPAELDDPTLDYYLSRAEMVAVGKVINDFRGDFGGLGGIDMAGEFQVAEAIKGKAAPGSTLSVDVIEHGDNPLKKNEELILFLFNEGGGNWHTDYTPFSKLPASPGVIAALKRLAAERGPALETPNLYDGADVEGISVRLQNGLNLWTNWVRSDIPVLAVSVWNSGESKCTFPHDQQSGELEVDGVWYYWANPTNAPDVAPAVNTPTCAQFELIVGTEWRAETQGVRQTGGLGAPLNLTPGTHKVRFAVMARREPSAAGPDQTPQFRAMSNPVEIEVWEDTFLSRRPPRSGGAANPGPTPALPEFLGP